jgi:uncharacterized membrane protein (DUF485 family)
MPEGPTSALPPDHDDHPEVITRNARHGILLFLVYLFVYGGFVAASAFAPDLMARPVLWGVNLAVAYGFGLIGLAILLAVVYMLLCGVARAEGDER